MVRTGISRWLLSTTYITPDGSYDILVNGSNHYINFGTLSGSSGYGIRDNGGTMEFKNSGGSWTAMGSGGGGGTWGSITGTLSAQTDLQSALDLKAPLTSPTFATSITGSYLTASQLLATDASKNIVSLAVATYPSLTELTYLKGVTSAIQTQLNAKQATISLGAIGASPNANGATLTGAVLNLEPASASFGGIMTTSTQTIAGAKTFSSSLVASAAFSVGGAGAFSSSSAGLLIGGGSTIFYVAGVSTGTSSTLTTGIVSARFIVGTSTVTTFTSGTHPLIVGAAFKPQTITNAGATVTNTATVYIESAMTGGTNNYALWADAGEVRIDGDIGDTTNRVTKVWAIDMAVTNAIAGSITGNAATVTNGVYTTGAGTVYQTPTGTPAGFIIASQAVGDILYASTTTAWSRLAAGTNGQVLTLAGGVPTWAAAGGGGGTPGGSSGQIQYNNAGAFGGDSNFTISSGTVTFGKDVTVNTLTLGLGASSIASNAGFGISVLAGITTGSYNLALGYEAMKTVTTGGHNIGIGYQAMYKSTGGGYNTGIGTNALSSITSGSGNHAIGSFCGQTITTGANNVGMGDYALGGNDGVMTSAGSNVAIGPTALGGLSTGSYNIGIGSIAGSAITTGQYNITIGRIAGSSITTGSYNIVIGYNPQVNSGTASNQMSIGNMIYGAGIDGSDTTISTGGIGIGVKVPTSRCDFIGSSTSRASLRILSGTAPTSPNDGDIWFDGTDLKMRVGGATKTFTLI